MDESSDSGMTDLSMLQPVLDMVLSGRFLIALALAWLVTPFIFIFIGEVVEDRRYRVPLWRYQARSFMPGDLFLGVIMATGWYLYPQEKGWWSHYEVTIPLALVGGAVLCSAARLKFDAPGYPKRSRNMPSKLYHDFVLYALYGPALFLIAVPGIFWTPYNDNTSGPINAAISLFIAWLLFVVWDNKNLTKEDKSRMHPATWQYALWVHKLFQRSR